MGDSGFKMIKSYSWNPWHGCKKISTGCKNCYVYRMDESYGRDSSILTKNKSFDLPIKKNRNGEYKIPGGNTLNTCFSSDFLLEDADELREHAWDMIRKRDDLKFFFITKRIDRFLDTLPNDWGSGYENVKIGCTVENQELADYRLPLFLKAPIHSKSIICSPLLGSIDLRSYLKEGIDEVVVGGESGRFARVCDYNWVLDIKNQCVDANVNFVYYQTGAKLLKDNKLYYIKRKYQHIQAKKANIDMNMSEEKG